MVCLIYCRLRFGCCKWREVGLWLKQFIDGVWQVRMSNIKILKSNKDPTIFSSIYRCCAIMGLKHDRRREWVGRFPLSLSKKQETMACSSVEAEYRALAVVTSELLWLRWLLRAFEVTLSSTIVLCDNKYAIQLAVNLTTHERSKHIDIDCHFLRSMYKVDFWIRYMWRQNSS